MGAPIWARRRGFNAAAAAVREWASVRCCATCGAALLASERASHHFALRGLDGVSREWTDLPTERLDVELWGSVPLGWDCHVADTFRREHPELVTDREFRTGR